MVFRNTNVSERTKCLIFLESSRTEGARKIPVPISVARVYALIEDAHKSAFQQFFNEFSRMNILIAEEAQDITVQPKNLTFEVFEFEFTYKFGLRMPNGIMPSVDVDEINRSVMKALLNRVHYLNRDPIRDMDQNIFHKVIGENIRFIEKWLNHGAQLVYRSRYRETLLHFAVRMDSESLVNTLLRFNFDVAASRYDCLSPMHIAAKRGHLGIIISLIRHGASINPHVENYRGLTPLMLAAKKGHLDVVRVFILTAQFTDCGNYLNAVRRPDGWSCLHLAAWKGFSAIVETLVQHGADMGARITEEHPEGATPLVLALGERQIEVAAILLRSGSEVNTTYDTNTGKISILDFALSNEDIEMIELILAHHPDPNNDFNRLAFYHALATHGKIFQRSVDIMCQQGFTVDDVILESFDDLQAGMVLFSAILKNCHSVVKAVLKNKAIVNMTDKPALSNFRFQCSPLHLAAATADEEMVKLLIDKGADVNFLDEDGKKPLFYAVVTGSVSVLKFLIAHQADVENQPELVYAAVYRGDPEIMRILLLHGAKVNDSYGGEKLELPIESTTTPTSSDPNDPNSTNVTIKFEDHALPAERREPPIFYASSRGNIAILKLMLKFGAVNSIEYVHCRKSPLMRAADCQHFEAFRLFLEDMFPKTDSSCGLVVSFRYDRRVTHPEYANLVAKYVLKVKSCGFPVCTNTLSRLWTLPITMEEFEANCQSEITQLKSNKVGNTNISYYDLLLKDLTTISNYARNDSVVKALRTEEFNEQFPIYASVIESQFEKTRHRRHLLTRGVQICCILIDRFHSLPFDLKEGIVNYLDNRDLQYLSGRSCGFLKED